MPNSLRRPLEQPPDSALDALRLPLVDHPLDRPHALRQAAIRTASARLGADAASYYMLVRGRDQVLRFHGTGAVGATPLAEETWRGGEGLAIVMTDADVDHVAPMNELGQPPDDFYTTALWRAVFERVGYRRVTYTNVTTGTLLRGHVSFLRTSAEPWEIDETRREESATALGRAFRAAWELEETLAAPDGVVTLRPDGSLAATDALSRWIAEHDAAPWLWARANPVASGPFNVLGTSEVAWAPGSFLRAQLIPGGGALLTFSSVVPMDLPPVLVRLTTLQRRVASLAAAGATAIEIARELDRSPETVREHLARIYARLGVASRSELATLCRRMLI